MVKKWKWTFWVAAARITHTFAVGATSVSFRFHALITRKIIKKTNQGISSKINRQKAPGDDSQTVLDDYCHNSECDGAQAGGCRFLRDFFFWFFFWLPYRKWGEKYASDMADRMLLWPNKMKIKCQGISQLQWLLKFSVDDKHLGRRLPSGVSAMAGGKRVY